MPERRRPQIYIDRLNAPVTGWLDEVRLALAKQVLLNGKTATAITKQLHIGVNTLPRFVKGYPVNTDTLERLIKCLNIEVKLLEFR